MSDSGSGVGPLASAPPWEVDLGSGGRRGPANVPTCRSVWRRGMSAGVWAANAPPSPAPRGRGALTFVWTANIPRSAIRPRFGMLTGAGPALGAQPQPHPPLGPQPPWNRTALRASRFEPVFERAPVDSLATVSADGGPSSGAARISLRHVLATRRRVHRLHPALSVPRLGDRRLAGRRRESRSSLNAAVPGSGPGTIAIRVPAGDREENRAGHRAGQVSVLAGRGRGV